MSATHWTIDPTHTRVEFGVKHMMFTTVRGHFGAFEGSVDFDAADPGQSAVNVTIDASSIDREGPMSSVRERWIDHKMMRLAKMS